MEVMKRRLQGAAIAVAIICASASPLPLRAQYIVNDPFHQLQNILTQLQAMAKDSAEYTTQAQRWYETYQHYQQQLVAMGGIVKSFALPAGRQMTEVAPDYMVQERCGGSFSLSGALAAISPRRDGDYISQQRDICSAMQRVQNIKYNDTIAFLRDTVPKMQADLKRVQEMRSQNNNNGTVDGSAEASSELVAGFSAQMQDWSARMQAYDGFVSSLQESQRQLARMALKGETNPIGTLVKTGALNAALKVGK